MPSRSFGCRRVDKRSFVPKARFKDSIVVTGGSAKRWLVETETSEGLSLASSTGVGTVTLSTTSKSSDSISSLTTAKVSSFTTLCATCSYEQFIEKPWEMMELLKAVRMRADLDDTYDTWMVSQEGGHSNSRRPDQVHRCWPEQQPCQLHGSN